MNVAHSVTFAFWLIYYYPVSKKLSISVLKYFLRFKKVVTLYQNIQYSVAREFPAGVIEEASAGNGRAQPQEVFLLLRNGGSTWFHALHIYSECFHQLFAQIKL